ncbi:hypothetical protein DFJ73DRAFT_883317 [Zopfochytrium polystomum]|nr:hypothetical protein DFJ73DRAFT_883317 [Zopfochytrium polystomum]
MAGGGRRRHRSSGRPFFAVGFVRLCASVSCASFFNVRSIAFHFRFATTVIALTTPSSFFYFPLSCVSFVLSIYLERRMDGWNGMD